MSPEIAPDMQSVETHTPSVVEIHRRIKGLEQFACGYGMSMPVTEPIPYGEQPVPEEFASGIEEIDFISQTGRSLVCALADPQDRDMALDSLLALEKVRRAGPLFAEVAGTPLREVDENGSNYLDALFDSGDHQAAIKALNFIYGRADTGGTSMENIGRYWPKVPEYADPGSASPESKRFYNNLLKIMPNNRDVLHSFLHALGYTFAYAMTGTWEMTGERNWVRENIRTMILLESIESGLCHKITDVFNIKNFARYDPDMLAEMYRAKMEEPHTPYVFSLTGASDHNGALSGYMQVDNRRTLQTKLAKRGIRIEEYECYDRQDMKKAISAALEQKRRYGSEVTDVLIDAHGSASRITFANNQEGWIHRHDLDDISRLSPVLRKSARIIVRSCSAARREKGAESSIASYLAQAAGRKVVGSSFNAPSTLKVKGRNEKTRVDAKFIANRHFLMTIPIQVALPGLGFKLAETICNFRAKKVLSPNTSR